MNKYHWNRYKGINQVLERELLELLNLFRLSTNTNYRVK